MTSLRCVGTLQWLIACGLILVLPVLLIKSQSVDPEKHAQILYDIATLKELNVILNEEVIESRFGMLPSYDKVVDAIDDIDNANHKFFDGLNESTAAELKDKWGRYTDAFDSKRMFVEDFKSHSAILRNSLQFLPVVVEEFMESQDGLKHQELVTDKVREILEKILVLSLDDGFEHVQEVEDLLAEIKVNTGLVSFQSLNLIESVIIHAETVFKYKKEVDDLVKSAYNIPISKLLDEVFVVYTASYESQQKLADTYRYGMFAVAAMLAIMVAFVLFRLKQATNRLNDSLEQLNFQKFALDQHAIVSIADVKGNITYANDKFCEISKFSREDLIGKNHRIVKSDEHPDDFFREMWRTIAAGKVWHGEIKNHNKDGGHYWVSSSIVPFLDSAGKPFQYVSIRTDITKRKNMEQDIRQARDEAEKANRSKSDFLANMSHEIRTPMNAVIGLSHLALQTDLTDKQHDYLTKILSSTTSLLRIINDILDFSKIEAGKMAIENVEFKLDQIIDEVCAVVCLKADEKQLGVYISKAPNVPNSLIGDPLRLRQVITNIANNAVKFTDKGEIIFALKVVSSSEKKIVLRFEIKDTGIGLTKEEVGALFKSFSQADASTTRKYGGTGLGLAICKNLIELMGGEIGVESEKGKGSTFFFTAEFEKGADADQPVAELPKEVRGLRVLVVDDKETAREIFTEILEGFDMDVVSVASGEAALEALEKACIDKHPYDLAVVDWMMPELDGIEVIHRIGESQGISPKPLVIMVTAYGRDEALSLTESSIPVEILSKPVSPSTFLDSIQRAMGKTVLPKVRVSNARANIPGETDKLLGADVLVAEDNAINQQVARELLESFGLTITIVNNGQEAVDALKERSFDGILLDVQMPVMDGYQTTRALRDDLQLKEVPIIAMTAHAMLEERERCLKAGMNDHVSKPIDPDALFDVLVKWVKPSKKAVRPAELQPKVNKIISLPDRLEGIQIENGLKRVVGNRELFAELLIDFRISHLNFMETLQKELQESNNETSLRHVHTTKGLAGQIGAETLQEKAELLESAIQAGVEDLVSKAMTNFGSELKTVLDSIASFDPSVGGHEAETSKLSFEDMESVNQLTDKLALLLKDGDLESIQVAKSMSKILSGSECDANIRALTGKLERFDFVGAEEILVEIQETLNDLT